MKGSRSIDPSQWEWGDPPATDRGIGASVARELSPLRTHPGKWAKIRGPYEAHAQASQIVQNIKQGKYKDVEPDEYEAESHRDEADGQVYIWARYVGGGPR